MAKSGRRTNKISILVVFVILVVTIVGCGEATPTSLTASQALEFSTRQVELNGVRLSVPENWYSQISPENEKVQRTLVSAKDPSVHGDVRIYTKEIQRPLEGPWIELASVAQYVMPEKSPSTQTVPSGVQITVFRGVEVGPFTTDQYYVPSKNLMITTRYWTPEEGNLINQIISSLAVID